MWKSEIWKGLDLAFGSGQETSTAEFEAWIDTVIQEPWATALQELTEQKGWWVGSEQQLIKELKTRAGEEVSRSSDFPTSLEDLYEYMAIADEAFRRLQLDIEDYREIPVEELVYKFDVPQWGWEAPILLHRGDSALRGYFLRAWEHPDPLPLALLLVAAKERTGTYKRWEGSTHELIQAICSEHLLARSDDEEYEKLFGTRDREDYCALYRRMCDCLPFLEEIGVRVSWIEGYAQSAEIVDDEGKVERDYGYWTTEVPLWKHKKGFID